MPYWILKTEPSTYSFADLEQAGSTVWDGVTNAQALINIRSMQRGDKALIYHSGDERAAVGLARIVSEPYPDPKLDDPKRTVVDLEPERPLAQPVSLAAIKAAPIFAQLALIRQPRLSIVPVSDEQWRVLMRLAGEG